MRGGGDLRESLKMNNSIIKTGLITIAVLTLLSIALPIFIDIFIFGNNWPSNITNGEWASFLGSLIGGLLGGVGTLAAVLFSIKENRELQISSNTQNYIFQMKFRFLDIIDEISLYVDDVDIIDIKLVNKLNYYSKALKISCFRKELFDDYNESFSKINNRLKEFLFNEYMRFNEDDNEISIDNLIYQRPMLKTSKFFDYDFTIEENEMICEMSKYMLGKKYKNLAEQNRVELFFKKKAGGKCSEGFELYRICQLKGYLENEDYQIDPQIDVGDFPSFVETIQQFQESKKSLKKMINMILDNIYYY